MARPTQMGTGYVDVDGDELGDRTRGAQSRSRGQESRAARTEQMHVTFLKPTPQTSQTTAESGYTSACSDASVNLPVLRWE
jgi:hypothetical protein